MGRSIARSRGPEPGLAASIQRRAEEKLRRGEELNISPALFNTPYRGKAYKEREREAKREARITPRFSASIGADQLDSVVSDIVSRKQEREKGRKKKERKKSRKGKRQREKEKERDSESWASTTALSPSALVDIDTQQEREKEGERERESGRVTFTITPSSPSLTSPIGTPATRPNLQRVVPSPHPNRYTGTPLVIDDGEGEVGQVVPESKREGRRERGGIVETKRERRREKKARKERARPLPKPLGARQLPRLGLLGVYQSPSMLLSDPSCIERRLATALG
ncbi:hypothetical protein KIPB_011569, partial [Kipferlia bialata]|eukprot:g11569.t1